MAEVAKLLGVELDEEFTLKDSSFTYRITKSGLKTKYNTENKWYNCGMLAQFLQGDYQILRKPKPILDKSEKRYLTQVIRPFKDQVISISKNRTIYGEFIDIEIDEAEDHGDIYLPYFKP